MLKHYEACPVCSDKQIQLALKAEDFTVSHEQFEIWHCNACSFRFTQNIPVKDEIGRYYQSENYISHSETKKGLINSLYHFVRKITLGSKRSLIQNTTGLSKGSVLDIGAGTGAFLHTMQTSGWNCTGTEPDETARKNAKNIYDINLQEEGELFSLPVNSFDAITMWHVLEHVHQLEDYMLQLKKLLKPNGKIFIAVPNYTSHDAQVYKAYWAAYDVPRHLYHFSPKAMRTLLSKHGFKLVATKPMWFDSYYVSLLSEKYKTGKQDIIKGFLTGAISNFKALFNKEKCSSVIYIISNA